MRNVENRRRGFYIPCFPRKGLQPWRQPLIQPYSKGFLDSRSHRAKGTGAAAPWILCCGEEGSRGRWVGPEHWENGRNKGSIWVHSAFHGSSPCPLKEALVASLHLWDPEEIRNNYLSSSGWIPMFRITLTSRTQSPQLAAVGHVSCKGSTILCPAHLSIPHKSKVLDIS